RLAGTVTVVPYANPIGSGQHLFGAHAGRFSLGSRVNFNRDFPLIDSPDPSLLPGDDAPLAAEERLKARLLALSLGHQIVLDLHCDDEAPSYLYVQKPLWPALADLAAALGSAAALVWDVSSNGAFDEAALRPWLRTEDAATVSRRVVATVEFRGEGDVSPALARADADGLYRFLVHRGVIVDGGVEPLPAWTGAAVPLENVEMVKATVGGAILYHVSPGDRVRAGDRLASILTDPGAPGGEAVIVAPQDGLVLTRQRRRFAQVGGDLLKLLGSRPSERAKPGTLED
ncbi:MAG TPA: succinylglutamate desuccinylase/aspartoacylase family protein, partial [Methylomirabilota bacterium]|nr:succinylglutamate desuccinylase/aspartoacylase family protein [Methylomirabilota bacterium]